MGDREGSPPREYLVSSLDEEEMVKVREGFFILSEE